MMDATIGWVGVTISLNPLCWVHNINTIGSSSVPQWFADMLSKDSVGQLVEGFGRKLQQICHG